MVMTGLYSYHHDPEVWGDPEVYRPERFLDESGNLLKKDVTLPFGAGQYDLIIIAPWFTKHFFKFKF